MTIAKMTVAQLRAALEAKGLDASGLKAALVARLEEAEARGDAAAAEPDASPEGAEAKGGDVDDGPPEPEPEPEPEPSKSKSKRKRGSAEDDDDDGARAKKPAPRGEGDDADADATKKDDDDDPPEPDAAAEEPAPASDLAVASDPSTLPAYSLDASTGEASAEVRVKGNEGRVIGKGGETVRRVESEFAVKVEMKRDRGVAVVTGAPDAVARAHAEIRRVVQNGDRREGADNKGVGGNDKMAPLPTGGRRRIAPFGVPLSVAPEDETDLPPPLDGEDMNEHVAIEIPCPGQEGRVIGKGGATIKEIERQTGATMKVEKGSGKCDAKGPRGVVIAARRAVLDQLALQVDRFVGTQGGQGGQGAAQRGGDWACPRCGANVFASKSSCFSCGAPKPAGMMGPMGGGGMGGMGAMAPMGMMAGGAMGAAMGVPGMMMSYHQQTAAGAPPGGVASSSITEAVPCRGREGAIIGKGGDMIKFIQTSTGCKLDMKRDVGTVQITGPPEGVAKARAFVEDVIEKGDTRGQGGLLDGVGGAAAPAGYAAAAPGYAAAAPGYAAATPGYAAAAPGAQQQPMGAAAAMGAMGMGGQQHAQPVAMMAVPVGAAAGGYYGVPQAYAPQAGAYAAQPQAAYVAAYQPQQQTAQGQPHAYAAYAQQPQQSAEQQQQGQQHQHAQQAEAGQQHGEWQTHYSEGRAYYYNTVTGETRWA